MDNLNKLIAGTEFDDLSLEEIIKKTTCKPEHTGIFNNNAQVWNHTFFWNSLASNGGGKPSEVLIKKIEESFGSFDDFLKELTEAAKLSLEVVGRGWFFKHIENSDGLYEIRVEFGSNIYRVFSFFDKRKLVILINGFQKKTRKTPKREIEKAEKLKKQYFYEKETK